MLLFAKNILLFERQQRCLNLLACWLTMRKRAAEHPLLTRNLTNVHDFGFGRALRSDAHGDVADAVPRGIILLVL